MVPKLLNVIRAGCWAHMQRKWHEAMPKGEIGKKSVAAQGYKYCNRLFRLEKDWNELSDADRQAERQEKAKPIIDKYYALIETITRPTGKLKEAVTYALNQKEFLCAFLDHGEIEISNNQVENAIRPFVVGRKGWLFSDTPAGAEATAIVYTLMETAKANNLRLEDYIEHLLTVLPERLADDPDAGIDSLLPWAYGMQKSFAMIRTGAYNRVFLDAFQAFLKHVIALCSGHQTRMIIRISAIRCANPWAIIAYPIPNFLYKYPKPSPIPPLNKKQRSRITGVSDVIVMVEGICPAANRIAASIFARTYARMGISYSSL
jgi:hypothetical protein